jgi:hypothetical protein
MRPSSNSQHGRKVLLVRNRPVIEVLRLPRIIRKPLDAGNPPSVVAWLPADRADCYRPRRATERPRSRSDADQRSSLD